MCLILGVGAGQRPFFMGKVIRIDFPLGQKVCPVIDVFPGRMRKFTVKSHRFREDAVGNMKCPSCGGPMKRNGRAPSGARRWRCRSCGASATHSNDVAARELAAFVG